MNRRIECRRLVRSFFRNSLIGVLVGAAGSILLASTGCSNPDAPSAAPSASVVGDRDAPHSGPARKRDDAAPRIIVLISVDTLRASHLSLYGHSRFTSPSIDTIAAEGVTFEDASATAPWTLPSHASILTGIYPLHHHVITSGTALPPRTPTLASLLAGEGYDTAAAVSSTWLRREKFRLTKDFRRYLAVDPAHDRRAPNTVVTDQGIAWLRENAGRKIFVFLHYYDVHSDYASEKEYERLFVTPYEGKADGTSWQLRRANLDDGYIEFCHKHFDPKKCTFGSTGAPFVVDENVERIRFDANDIRHIEELYDAGVRQMDAELGRFFAFLRGSGLLDETLLILMSDHGEEFLDHGRVSHFLTTYQEILHIPLVLRGPGIPRGRRVSVPVSSVDIVPTVLALVRAQSELSFDGRDLSPLWSGGDSAPFESRYLYGEAAGGLTFDLVVPGYVPVYRSIRKGRYKLIYNSKADHYSLYDLESDPGERADIAADQPALTSELVGIMKERYRDFTPVASPENRVELNDEDAARLRALGYVVP